MTAALTDTAPASMLDRFTAIIDAFEDASAALTLDQIAARARLPRSTTHRILDQLVRLRWLTHSGRGYRLGARTSSWGTGESADARLRSVAAPVLHDLQMRTGAVVHLGCETKVTSCTWTSWVAPRPARFPPPSAAACRLIDWHWVWPRWPASRLRTSSPN